MAAALSETDAVDAAVEEAVELVAAGDTVLVAAAHTAEKHDVPHRFADVRERVQEALGDE
jgi:hypothetical protein